MLQQRITTSRALVLCAWVSFAGWGCSGGSDGNSFGAGGGGLGGAGGAAGAGLTGGIGGVGAGGVTGGSGGTGGAMTEPDPLEDCAGVSIEQDGVLDVDLRAVSVSGSVTLNGGALPEAGADRGQIVFTDALGFTAASVSLGTSGPGNYALRIPPTTYKVTYVPNAGTCAGAQPTGMPCNGGILLDSIAILADGVLDVDIPVVVVSGSVTLNRAVFPDQATGRGSLSFSRSEQSATTASFGTSGPVSYRIALMPGSYDVTFVGDPSGCSASAVPPSAPCVSGTLLRAVNITNGVLDVDVPAVRVTGSVTVNGAPMPDELNARGSLSFSGGGRGTGAAATRNFGGSGLANYGMTVIPGTYDVAFVPGPSLCAPGQTPQVPCIGGTVVSAASLTADGVLDVDIPAVTVSGSVTLLGGPLPNESGERGTVTFENNRGGSGGVTLGSGGPLTYWLRVLAGTYDIDFVANPALCTTSVPPQMPCTGGSLVQGAALTTDGVLDLNLQRVRVNGSVTARGGPLPDAADARGAIRFVGDGSTRANSAGFSAVGPAAYAITLWPGTYDVHLDANNLLCGQGIPAPPMPCIGGALRADVPLMMDGVLDLDLIPIRLNGTVTVNGMPAPPESSNRGSIRVSRAALEGGGSASVALGATEPANYAVTLLPGRYVLSHEAERALCMPGFTLPTVPCASQVLLGCTP